MEVHYRTIERKRDILRYRKQKIEKLWKTLHTIRSSDNPRRTLDDMYEPPVGLKEICPPPGGYTRKDL